MKLLVPSTGSTVMKICSGEFPNCFIPDSSLIRVKFRLFLSRISIIAFSATKSTSFMGSPPAPVPRLGCGSSGGFSSGWMCFRTFSLQLVRIWCQSGWGCIENLPLPSYAFSCT